MHSADDEVLTGFWDGLSYSTPQKSKETRGNAITQLGPIHP